MISFTADGKDYKLEVTAATIKQMEREGVNFAELGSKLQAGEILWKGLFIAHHNTTPNTTRMMLYRALAAAAEGDEPEVDEDGNPVDALMVAIVDEYYNAINSLKRAQGNVAWRRS